jgi:hypothetical protein
LLVALARLVATSSFLAAQARLAKPVMLCFPQ